ncbi:pyridoxal kinase [soil metagenome]
MNILSIQSWVAYGHVGNAAAAFPMQRLGHEVWTVNTVQFSNHTGYGQWTGQVFTGEAIHELMRGIADRGVLPRCDGVLSGYMGAVDIGAAILDAVAAVKAANPQALYCCDPVIGDVGRGIFVRPGIPEMIRDKVVPGADIITPNHFELEYLSGRTVRSDADLAVALDVLHERGPATILVTSFQGEMTPKDSIDLVVSEAGSRWRVCTPRLPISVNGAGDAIAALFFVHRLNGDPAQALSRAASSVYGVLKRTAAGGHREIALIEAQEEFVRPTEVFKAVKL